jgi:hypothetical protein
VQGTCATTGDGLYEGLDWLGQQINKIFKQQMKLTGFSFKSYNLLPLSSFQTLWSSVSCEQFDIRE